MSKKSNGNIDFFNIDTKKGSNGVPRGVKRGQMGSNGVIASPIIISSHPHPPPHGGPRLMLTETVLVTKYCRC